MAFMSISCKPKHLEFFSLKKFVLLFTLTFIHFIKEKLTLIQKKALYMALTATLKYTTDFHLRLPRTYGKSKSVGEKNTRS